MSSGLNHSMTLMTIGYAGRSGGYGGGGWGCPSVLIHLSRGVGEEALRVVFAGKEKVSVCRARRAQLPPMNVWIFPPRSLEHSSRSWYFEWPGQEAAHHKM